MHFKQVQRSYERFREIPLGNYAPLLRRGGLMESNCTCAILSCTGCFHELLSQMSNEQRTLK